jgi:hypothetical protein
MPASPLLNDPDSGYCYDPRDDERKPCLCGDTGWLDVHDDVQDESDLYGCEWELIDGRIHVPCRDCQGAFSDLAW